MARPYGLATSFVVSFVLALNTVNVAAATTILVLHLGVIGHHIPCHYDFMFLRRSYHVYLRARGSGAVAGSGLLQAASGYGGLRQFDFSLSGRRISFLVFVTVLN